ncbi:MAG: rhodanese-like domain-containing protein [Spirosomataceae bacterium]
MKRQLLLVSFLSLWFPTLHAQFKYDNTVYRTVYLEDLPAALRKSPNALLLDVRSAGEFSDTSQYAGLNIGHFKGAKNINVRELSQRIGEISDYKNKPVFVYCSHSQRSRVSSKILIDSGFVNVVNVNGGMSKYHLIKNESTKGLNEMYETANAFKLLSPKNAYQLMTKKEVFVLDIRSDSVFRRISKSEIFNAFGQLKGAVNVPFSELAASLSKIPRNKPVLIVDNFGNENIKAAQLLTQQRYEQVYVLFNGMDAWVSETKKEFPQKEKLWMHPQTYSLLSPEEFAEKADVGADRLLLDIRSTDEFTNREKKLTYRNRGHIQNAVNIPSAVLNTRWSEVASFKNKEVIVYGFANDPEAYEAAKLLTDNGFSKVKVLIGGLWNIRWKAANLKGLSHLMKLVVDVPEENL